MILLCYDGSQDSQTAIARAGELLPGQAATVLTVWEGFVEVLERSGGMGFWPGGIDFQEIDAATEQRARERAEAGAELARRAGLDARPCARKRGATIAATILAEADVVNAAAIVLGTRGLTGLKSLLLGSVSHAVVQHAGRPVIIVPSNELAARRASC